MTMSEQIMEEISDILINEEIFSSLIDKFQVGELELLNRYLNIMKTKIYDLNDRKFENEYLRDEITDINQMEIGQIYLLKYTINDRAYGIIVCRVTDKILVEKRKRIRGKIVRREIKTRIKICEHWKDISIISNKYSKAWCYSLRNVISQDNEIYMAGREINIYPIKN